MDASETALAMPTNETTELRGTPETETALENGDGYGLRVSERLQVTTALRMADLQLTTLDGLPTHLRLQSDSPTSDERQTLCTSLGCIGAARWRVSSLVPPMFVHRHCRHHGVDGCGQIEDRQRHAYVATNIWRYTSTALQTMFQF
jgi:hypothetical protein